VVRLIERHRKIGKSTVQNIALFAGSIASFGRPMIAAAAAFSSMAEAGVAA
jgi:hypothetical protein